ncbi:MAG: hypothetical protein FJW14_07455 [Acidimicrobiia bacterium]|nr:hypothetical protein [Acidimicrobiia bacterium]
MLLPPNEAATRRLHHELETTIREVNHELISASTGTITRNAFTDVARMVAGLRGRYLQCVLRLGNDALRGNVDTKAALELKSLREAYAEAVEGFAALEHALQRGYIALAD